MDFLSDITEIIKYVLIFVAVMFGLLIALAVIIAKMPDDNPLKRILYALSYRVGASATAGIVAIPVEPIPGLDAVYDVAVPIALVWYWFTFFRETYRAAQRPSRPARIGVGRDPNSMDL
jgi:hypothetical protein